MAKRDLKRKGAGGAAMRKGENVVPATSAGAKRERRAAPMAAGPQGKEDLPTSCSRTRR